MNETRFIELLGAYGADLSRWPEEDRERELRLHIGEVVAEAHARATTERQIHVAMSLCFELRLEAIRIEALGLVPKTRRVMHHPG